VRCELFRFCQPFCQPELFLAPTLNLEARLSLAVEKGGD
jgi:hypothetical protein